MRNSDYQSFVESNISGIVYFVTALVPGVFMLLLLIVCSLLQIEQNSNRFTIENCGVKFESDINFYTYTVNNTNKDPVKVECVKISGNYEETLWTAVIAPGSFYADVFDCCWNELQFIVVNTITGNESCFAVSYFK